MGAYTRFQQQVKEKGVFLRGLSSDDLLSRANTPTETLRFGWSTGTISVMIEQHGLGLVRVVVQGFLRFPSWSPAASVALDGFYKSADGTIREVPDSELGDFW